MCGPVAAAFSLDYYKFQRVVRGQRPVFLRNDARLGVHTGLWEYARVKITPLCTRLPIVGVRIRELSNAWIVS